MACAYHFWIQLTIGVTSCINIEKSSFFLSVFFFVFFFGGGGGVGVVVTKEGVTKLLKGLNPSEALGPDELHPRVLKELATELGPVFAHLFQQSIDKGEIPKEWSLADICPLFKKGDRSLACNYRPVSLTCVPCKLLEHIVCSNIMAHLDEHRLLSEKQHAFRKWHRW